MNTGSVHWRLSVSNSIKIEALQLQANECLMRLRTRGNELVPGGKIKDIMPLLSRDELERMYLDALVVCNNVTKVILDPIVLQSAVPIVRAAPGAFAAPKYTLDRDRAPPPPPVAEKTCRECDQTKPNTFEFFGKKWSGSRTNYVTVDVCKICANAKIRKSVQLSKLKSFQHQKYDELIAKGRTHDEAIVECKQEANPLLEVLREKGVIKGDE